MVALGLGSTALAPHSGRLTEAVPFPLTLNLQHAALIVPQVPPTATPTPVLHTALDPNAEWRAPAGWQPRSAPRLPSRDETAEAVAEPAATRTKTIAVRRGDTLIDVLTREGAATDDAQAAIEALRPLYDPKRLRVGQEMTLTFARYETAPAENGKQLITVAIPADVDRDVKVSRAGDGDFRAEEIVHPLQPGYLKASGTINDSLFLAATQSGVPVETTLQLIRLFSYDVDFQRDVQPGDRFEVLYRVYYDEDGHAVKTGDVLCARLATKGRTFGLYRYTLPDGDTDYFDENGRSSKKALMRTPIDGARISSRFGMRKHPILGYSRMHKGLDFAAPIGTPIMAAGDGVVEFVGPRKGYGRYVKLRHFGPYETAYGHMSRFAAGLHAGMHVKQGQIIAYVGMSGMATGPHLHYEVLVKGDQINPASGAVPINKMLGGKALASFERARSQNDRQFALAPSSTMLAAKSE